LKSVADMPELTKQKISKELAMGRILQKGDIYQNNIYPEKQTPADRNRQEISCVSERLFFYQTSIILIFIRSSLVHRNSFR
jgi:hypothetical protein